MSDNGSEGDPQEQPPTIGTYVGERAATGERHGKGTNVFPNGDIYDGQYEAGQRHGQGMYTWKKPKAKYVGSYIQNVRHGEGIFAYPDGSRYKGHFENGKRSGRGLYVYPGGDMYEGGWAKDLKHGPGIYTFATSKTKLQGTWDNGWLTGDAEIIRVDHVIKGAYAQVKEKKPLDPNDSNSETVETVVDSKLKLPCAIEFKSSGYTMQCNYAEQVGLGMPPPVAEET